MPKFKGFGLLASAVLLGLLIPQGRPTAEEAPETVFLLRTQCVDTGIGNWGRQTEDVSVGRAVYRSRLYMGPGNRFAAFTCKIQPNENEVNFQSIQLEFGMRDNDRRSPGVTVNVYLDGRKADSRTVAPGEKGLLSFDVANVSNVALEAVCTTQTKYCDRVYFWNASLVVLPPLPPNPTPTPSPEASPKPM